MIGSTLDLSTPMPIEDAIWLSLHTVRGSFWQQPDFGSDLFTLGRAKMTPDMPKRVEGMAASALSWLVRLDRLRDLRIASTVLGHSRLELRVQAVGINGVPISLSMFVPVGVVP